MMEALFIGLALLLPVAAITGYVQGKKSAKSKDLQEKLSLSKNYFAGLNYVLNEESDKAIEAFIQMLEVDSETIETHLALGNLFRKRGEVDRSIRVHQNLIARPSLSPDYRKAALMELGQDYLAAGLYDRAESIFRELLNDSRHRQKSLEFLLTIHQQMRDWDKAAQVAEQLASSGATNMQAAIAHYYCEQAEETVARGNVKAAQMTLKKALGQDRNCVRASLLQAKLFQQADNFKESVKCLRRLKKQDIAFLPEALSMAKATFYQLKDKNGYKDFLSSSLEQGAGVSTMLALADEIQQEQGESAAAQFIADYLREKPALKGLKRLIELQVDNTLASEKSSLTMLVDIVTRLLRDKPAYQCINCGFAGKSLHWQCPNCKHWNTVKPIHGLEGE